MKKLLILLVSTSITVSGWSQAQIDNNGFENWEITSDLSPHDDKANDWNTVNSSLDGIIASTLSQTCFQEANAFAGSYSVRLKTVAPPLPSYPTVNGITTNGTINTTSYGVEGGVAFTDRPDSLTGWYQCAPMSNDYGTIEFVLEGASGDTIGWARFETPTTAVSSWTQFSVPVVYRNGTTPAKAITLLSSSNGFGSVVGSELMVDELALIYNPASVAEYELEVGAYYVNNTLNIIVDAQKGNVELIDLNGRLVAEFSLVTKKEITLTKGIYLLKLNAEGKSGVQKFVVD